MQNKTLVSNSFFKQLFAQTVPLALIRRLFRLCGPARRCPAKITPVELIMSLVFHVLAEPARWPNTSNN